MIKTVYVASPYSNGDKEDNACSSMIAGDILISYNFVPFLPLLTHYYDLFSPKTYEVWLKMDMEWVKRCDCVLRLPGRSSGADREVLFAESLNIPVFYSVDALLFYQRNFHEKK